MSIPAPKKVTNILSVTTLSYSFDPKRFERFQVKLSDLLRAIKHFNLQAYKHRYGTRFFLDKATDHILTEICAMYFQKIGKFDHRFVFRLPISISSSVEEFSFEGDISLTEKGEILHNGKLLKASVVFDSGRAANIFSVTELMGLGETQRTFREAIRPSVEEYVKKYVKPLMEQSFECSSKVEPSVSPQKPSGFRKVLSFFGLSDK